MSNCLGRYQLHKRITSNAVVARYAATARLFPGFNKPCLVQVVSKNVSAEKDFEEGLRREAALALRMSHPNVQAVIDIIEHQGQWVIACEGVDGCDLEAFCSSWWRELQRPPPQEAVLFIARELLTGLDYCYRMARQVYGTDKRVYRDLSPANVLLSREGSVKLADFGLGISSTRRQQFSHARDDFQRIGLALFELMLGEQTSPESDFTALSARFPSQVRSILLKAINRRYASVVEFRGAVQRSLTEIGPRFSNWELANLVRGQLDGSTQQKKKLALSLERTELVCVDQTVVEQQGVKLFTDEELATHPVTGFSPVGELVDLATAEESPVSRRPAAGGHNTEQSDCQVIDLRRRGLSRSAQINQASSRRRVRQA